MTACRHLATAARVAEHPVDVRLARTEAERRPNTPPLWGELAKKNLGHAPLLATGYLTSAGNVQTGELSRILSAA